MIHKIYKASLFVIATMSWLEMASFANFVSLIKGGC